jgi:hypothetical protein
MRPKNQPQRIEETEMQRTEIEMRKKKAEQPGKYGKVRRMARRGGPHGAPPRKQQQLPTKAEFPGPFSGFQMTVPTVY